MSRWLLLVLMLGLAMGDDCVSGVGVVNGTECGAAAYCPPAEPMCCSPAYDPWCCPPNHHCGPARNKGCVPSAHDMGASPVVPSGGACGNGTVCAEGSTCCRVAGVDFCCPAPSHCDPLMPLVCVPPGYKLCQNSTCCPWYQTCCDDSCCTD